MLEEKVALHELNNTLTVIAGMTDLLQNHLKDNHDKYLRDRLFALRQAVTRAVAITKRSGWEFAKKDKAVVDIAAQVKKMAGVLHMIAGNAATLCINVDSECLAEADPVDVEGFIINLVKNAAEAMTDDKGKINVAVTVENCKTVCSTCGKPFHGRYVVCEVSNNGKAIAAAELLNIFNQNHTTKPGGQGLGLYHLRLKAHLLGGHVTVVSSPGCTIFRVYLLPAELSVSKPLLQSSIPAGKKAILLAGDNGGSALLGDYLNELGVKVVEPKICHSADFIVYDPDIDIVQAMETIDACARGNREIPVICVTNYHVGKSIAKNTFYLTKPFDRHNFARIVKQALNAC